MNQPFFFIRHQGRHQKIMVAEIAYLESRRNYVRIVTGSRDLTRIHRAFIVNLDWIQAFDRCQVYGQDQTLPIGERYSGAHRERVVVVTQPSNPARNPV